MGLPRCRSVVVSVEDEGAGMDESQLRQLFGEGVQFDPNRLQHGGGSGLGLFISRNIVLLHGGILEAQSDGLGHGATFNI
jgi:two-component system sensor histidine kinase BaeS